MGYSDNSLNGTGTRTGNIGLLYIMSKPSHCNLCGNLNGTGNLTNGLSSHSAPYLVNLWGELTVISMSDPDPI